MCWPREGLLGHREHSKRTKAEARSIGSFNGGSRGFLCPAIAPDLQVGVFATATRAPQGFGVAHDSGVIACKHPVVAGGTTVTAAVPGGGRVHRNGGALVLHSGDLFLVWLLISCAVDRTKQGTSLAQVHGCSWSRAGMFSLHMEHLTR